MYKRQKYWFKTAANGIDLDGIGIDDEGALAKLTLDENLFVGCSSGGNAYACLLYTSLYLTLYLKQHLDRSY